MAESDTLTLSRALEILPPSPIPEEEEEQDSKRRTTDSRNSSSVGFEDHMRKLSSTSMISDRASSTYQDSPSRNSLTRDDDNVYPMIKNIPSLEELNKKGYQTLATSTTDVPYDINDGPGSSDIICPVTYVLENDRKQMRCRKSVIQRPWVPIIGPKLEQKPVLKRSSSSVYHASPPPMPHNLSTNASTTSSGGINSVTASQHGASVESLMSPPPTPDTYVAPGTLQQDQVPWPQVQPQSPSQSKSPKSQPQQSVQQSNGSIKSRTFSQPSIEMRDTQRQKLLQERMVQRPWMKPSVTSPSVTSPSVTSPSLTSPTGSSSIGFFQATMPNTAGTATSATGSHQRSSVSSIPSIGEAAIVGSLTRSNSEVDPVGAISGIGVPPLSPRQPAAPLSMISSIAVADDEPDDEIYAAGVTPPISLFSHVPPIFGTQPPQLYGHCCTLVEDKLFIFGGKTTSGYSNKMYIFNCTTNVLSCLSDLTSMNAKNRNELLLPPPCRGMSAVLMDKYIYYFGGADDEKYYNHLYLFNTRTLKFKKIQTNGRRIPIAREGHSAVANNKSTMLIFGGRNRENIFNDVWRLQIDDSDPTRVSFSEVISLEKDTTSWPVARSFHSAHVVQQDQMLIYGGCNGEQVFDDLWLFNMHTDRWNPFGQTSVEICQIGQHFPVRHADIPYSSGSCPRTLHSSDIIGDYLVVTGGHDGTIPVDYISILDLKRKRWMVRNLTGMSSRGECYHTAVIYDSRCFIVGGRRGKEIISGMRIVEMTLTSFLIV